MKAPWRLKDDRRGKMFSCPISPIERPSAEEGIPRAYTAPRVRLTAFRRCIAAGGSADLRDRSPRGGSIVTIEARSGARC